MSTHSQEIQHNYLVCPRRRPCIRGHKYVSPPAIDTDYVLRNANTCADCGKEGVSIQFRSVAQSHTHTEHWKWASECVHAEKSLRSSDGATMTTIAGWRRATSSTNREWASGASVARKYLPEFPLKEAKFPKTFPTPWYCGEFSQICVLLHFY